VTNPALTVETGTDPLDVTGQVEVTIQGHWGGV
jgi:hypothetical protein